MPAPDYKRCPNCGERKPLTEFHRHSGRRDGRSSYCKECACERARKWEAENRERANRTAREWNRANPDKVAARHRRWIEAHPEKRAAQVQLGHAIEAGRIVRPTNCEDCGSDGLIHGHHDDYSKPLDVRWLCPRCHKAAHREMEAAA